MNQPFIYGVQVLFVCSIAVGSQTINSENKYKWLNVARYIIYLLTIKSIPKVCQIVQKYQTSRYFNLRTVALEAKDYVISYVTSVALLLYFEESLFRVDFVYIGAAYLVVKYPQMAAKSSINYGVGMACSYFEGYLVHILPSDGAKFVGFEESIRALEDREGVLFPVKKLFIVINKSMYCPPDLKDFNRGTDLPKMESFNYLEDIVKSVAGVKNRIYRNTAYKVNRAKGPPVSVMAECATPLHTLHRVLQNRSLYQELADIDVDTVVNDFCTTLRTIIDKSPECRSKCELIYYDDNDPKQNLGEILVNRIRELVPDFEEKIIARKNQNFIEEE